MEKEWDISWYEERSDVDWMEEVDGIRIRKSIRIIKKKLIRIRIRIRWRWWFNYGWYIGLRRILNKRERNKIKISQYE